MPDLKFYFPIHQNSICRLVFSKINKTELTDNALKLQWWILFSHQFTIIIVSIKQVLHLSPDLCTENMTRLSFLPISCRASCGYKTKTGVFTTCVSSSSLTPSFVLFVSMQAAAVLNPLAKKLSYFLDQCCLERCYNGSLPFSWMKCSLQHWELSSKHASCLGHKAF